jgi:hypothetical protein
MPTKRNEWCPRDVCTPYNAPEQLCGVCLSVYRAITKAVKENVEQAVKAEKDRILRELPGVFGKS